MSEPTALIFKRMADVMADVGFIGKDRLNEHQRYNFRGIDDVYNSLHEILSKHRIFVIPEVISERSEQKQTKNGVALYRILSMRYTFYTDDGSHIACTVIGEGMDSGDKAANKAMSVAQKYALLQVFLIPTKEDKDPEVDSHQVVANTAPAAPEIYNGHPDQRRKVGFAEMCKKVGVETLEGMKAMSKSCEGTPVHDLFNKMQRLIQEEQAQLAAVNALQPGEAW